MQTAVICPECNTALTLKKSKEGKKFFACPAFPACRYTHPADKDGKPIGVPVPQETKNLRKKVYEAIEKCVSVPGATIGEMQIYQNLHELLGTSRFKIGELSNDDCKLVLDYTAELLEEIKSTARDVPPQPKKIEIKPNSTCEQILAALGLEIGAQGQVQLKKGEDR